MANVFIVRPFGNRSVLKKENGTITTIQFDFDRVEKELIKPAMQQCNLAGGTTGEVFEAGDIREDMFSGLLLADLVIADITIYNANVFYELGIRHALRDKRTILLKCPGFDETPFDIIGYRYISYKKDNPADSLDALVRSIEETLNGDRRDSPVFNVLPHLKTQDPEKYLAIPEDFIREVRIAGESKAPGKLALLAYEAESFSWWLPAMRLVGESLYKIKYLNTAKTIWEKITSEKEYDTQANERLATIYQRLAETEMKTNPEEGIALLVKSDLAIERLIKDHSLTGYQRAEAYALKARNAKTRWINSWNSVTDDKERGENALQSIYLENAYKNYEKGFMEDLNHFYSGINALGLLTTIITLAERYPNTWEAPYETAETAKQKLQELKSKCQRLASTLQFSIEAAKSNLEAKGETDNWLAITEADFISLTATNPARVAAMYKKVIAATADLNTDATARQLKIYETLGVKIDNIKAALKVMPADNPEQKTISHFLLFTGHMIDKPDRKEPRFPTSKENAVRQTMKENILEEKNKLKDRSLVGIAGGACGGDILFHEICRELGIRSLLFLALPEDNFKAESVSFAGVEWIERFNQLVLSLPHPVLSDTKELPKWLQQKKDYSIWERNNLWELNAALVNGGINMTLIALWDKKPGDGSGGTENMIQLAEEKGAKVVLLDINQL